MDGKVRLLTKREQSYILERLNSTDISIITSFVTKHTEESEAVQLSFYDNRHRLGCAWNKSRRLPTLLSFLLSVFFDLLERHIRGNKQLAQFLGLYLPASTITGVPEASFVFLHIPVTLLLASILVTIASSHSYCHNHMLNCNYSTALATCTQLQVVR